MTTTHALEAGTGGQWEVTHYREQIRIRTERGDPPAVIEALYKKLLRSIEKWGDPDTDEGKAREAARLAAEGGSK